MLSDGTQAASFIPILYSTIKNAGLSTGIACCDAEGWNDQVTYTQQLSSAGAEQYLARITSHWYTSQGTSPISTTLRVWETEYADLNDAFTTTWYSSGAFNEGFTWAGLIYQGIVECNLSAFLYWIGKLEFPLFVPPWSCVTSLFFEFLLLPLLVCSCPLAIDFEI
jgi:hypothetical protein